MYDWLLWLMWKSTLAFTDRMKGCFLSKRKRPSITVKWLIYCQEMGQRHKLWKFNSFLRILEFTGCVSQLSGDKPKPGDEIKKLRGGNVRFLFSEKDLLQWCSNKTIIAILSASPHARRPLSSAENVPSVWIKTQSVDLWMQNPPPLHCIISVSLWHAWLLCLMWWQRQPKKFPTFNSRNQILQQKTDFTLHLLTHPHEI